eukprot:14488481-Alexandrium_andersonii.AAC.1
MSLSARLPVHPALKHTLLDQPCPTQCLSRLARLSLEKGLTNCIILEDKTPQTYSSTSRPSATISTTSPAATAI